MPVFARRRLQQMLDDLSIHLDHQKSRDLVERVESTDVDQALPGEMELAILWAIANTGDIVIEPEWWGDNRRPDAISESVVPGVQIAVEIAAPTDNSISPENAMYSVARSISDFCNRLRKTTGDHLYFRFGETVERIKGRNIRKVLAHAEFKLSEEQSDRLREWIFDGRFNSEKITLTDPGISVEVEWREHSQTPYHNIWTSLPPQAYSLEKNPLFTLLRRKADQLRAATEQTVRIIVIADRGSTLLSHMGKIGENDRGRQSFSAQQIIQRFIQLHSQKIDGVIALSPRKELRMGSSERKWVAKAFHTDAGKDVCVALSKILESLPLPRFTGHQATSLFRQGCFSPKAMGWYLGLSMEGKLRDRNDPDSGWQESVKIPARIFLDLMAGRITEAQFRHFLGERDGESNFLTGCLEKGLTISGAGDGSAKCG